MDFHSLRMTFGTNLVLSGAHPRVVQELMRHSDIRQTMKLYTDVSKLPVREAVAGLPSYGIQSNATRINLIENEMEHSGKACAVFAKIGG